MNSITPSLSIRQALPEDMPFILSLAKREKWNPGLQDHLPFYTADPNGFFIGEIENEKIGCISAVAYESFFGFIGFFIVVPKYRKCGYGLQLWKRAMHYLHSRTIGLDGVIDQQKMYQKAGFQTYYRNFRFEAKGVIGRLSSSLSDLKKIPLDSILEYDLPIFGVSRKKFLKQWTQMTNSYGLAAMKGKKIVGYGVLRSCVIGYKIGPLFADNAQIALELYQGLSAKANQSAFFLDVPEINQAALDIANQFNMNKVFETARMYAKSPLKQQIEKIYGVTSFELG